MIKCQYFLTLLFCRSQNCKDTLSSCPLSRPPSVHAMAVEPNVKTPATLFPPCGRLTRRLSPRLHRTHRRRSTGSSQTLVSKKDVCVWKPKTSGTLMKEAYFCHIKRKNHALVNLDNDMKSRNYDFLCRKDFLSPNFYLVCHDFDFSMSQL